LKLYYRVEPSQYQQKMEQVRERFGMHQEVDEQRTTLLLDTEDTIEQVAGDYNPRTDEVANIRVVLIDESLKEVFDAILGEPYKVR
jgi:hypothetical protein